jgi:cell surface protein SprA
LEKGIKKYQGLRSFVVALVMLGVVTALVWKSDASIPLLKLQPYELFPIDSGVKYQGTATDQQKRKLDLQNPPNIERNVDYDPVTRQYVITETIGGKFYKNPVYMNFDEYQKYEAQRNRFDYWKQRSAESQITSGNGMIPKVYVNNQVFDRIFGGGKVDIRPQGTAELIFAGRFNRNDNPILNERQRKTQQFDFDQKIQLNLIGNIGDKLKTTVNYNTEATFDFENQMRMEYTGYEDEIIKKIELGNVSLPLNSSLISGSQSLFGIKTQLQFGNLTVTSVMSNQKSEKKQIKITNGAQRTEFKFLADNYEANKHFFLSHYFREEYDKVLNEPPIIKTNVLISRVEVWVTNRSRVGDEDTRDVLAFIDLGENSRVYSNNPNLVPSTSPYPNSVPGTGAPASNNLLDIIPASARNVGDNAISGYFADKGGPDNYAKIRARKLTEREYTFHPQLGYISLNAALNADEVLAVSYRYTVNGVEYTVGEFSNERSETNPPTMLFTKLLKNVSLKTSLPLWDLMMKNIYSLNAFQINSEDFKLDALYLDEKTANNINYLPVGPDNVKNIPLIRVLGLDKLDVKQTLTPDGIFDFIPGITVNTANGRIIFPKIEPFGSYLLSVLAAGGDSTLAKSIAFTELYDSTRFKAQQLPSKNKFTISGSFQSTSNSEFSLNAINIPQGSVVVKSGTQVLTEGVDYTVDYNVGRVKIINSGILNSGSPITVDLESSTLFGVQARTFIGTRLDYKVNEKLLVGGTFLRLSERPLTQKVNIGEEPIANNMYGLDLNYRTESNFLTALVDKIPFIQTKAPSTITASGEYALLDPGHSRLLNTPNNKSGISYIDDFEGSRSSIDLKSFTSWQLSSTPAMFNESILFNDLSYGFNRAQLAFYQVDNLFYSKTDNRTPAHIRSDRNQLSNHYMREVSELEVFPNKQIPTGQPNLLSTLDLTYFPRERGPYNFTVNRLNADGSLKDPLKSWGGIMRRIESNDFEALNVEFIEFWMMDPFIYNPGSSGGDLYFNLGSISEDVLKDGKESIENGLPGDGDVTKYDTTTWGRVGALLPLTNVFNNEESARVFQDVGLDGLNDEQEREFFQVAYLNALEAAFGQNSPAYQRALADPAGDNYTYYRGSELDNNKATILDRYKYYNGHQGNSPTEAQSVQRTGLSSTANTPNPDTEDINRDNAQSDRDEYFQYRVRLTPGDLENPDANSFVTDKVVTAVRLANGKTENVTWYQFRIPINKYENRVGEIQDFRAIRFIRAFLTNFSDTVTLRFARLQLVRGEWRRLEPSVRPGEGTEAKSDAIFDLSTINVEENGNRVPIPYVLPPGIVQEINLQDVRGTTRVNEQSLLLNACNFKKDDQVMAYKITGHDFRSYKKVEMFIHAEGENIQTNEMAAFVRFGLDYSDNYYEYEIPLAMTPANTKNPDEIWPGYNKMELPLAVLQVAKQLRNSTRASVNQEFFYQDGKNKVWIKGNPDLGNVRSIVVGVRNTSATPNDPKCVQVWFNELLLTEFDEQGGWAATGRINAQLADFANVTVSGSKSTVGFGSIDKKVSERNRSDDFQYDVASSVELGKFFPERTGIRVPMYASYAEIISTPQFAPNNPDILLSNVLNELTAKEQDSLKRITEDYTRRKSISFTNVKKDRVDSKKKVRVYDIENFSLTYTYNDLYRRNYNIEYDIQKNYKGALAYNFSNQPKEVRPFDKIVNNKNLRIVKDFNFNYKPTALDFRIDVDRAFAENKIRNINEGQLRIDPTFNKDFRISRVYGLRYDLSKSLKLDYSATNMAIVDEPFGRIDTEQEKDSLWRNLQSLGRTVDFSQITTLTYTVPINKLPYLEWTQLLVSYNARYDWKAAPLATPKFENVISNSQSIQVNPTFNLTQLYGRSKYLKALMAPQRSPGMGNKNNPLEKMKVNKTEAQNKADSIANELNKPSLKKALARTLIMVRNMSFSYRETNGQLLPGYLPRTDLFGMDFGQNNAPGFGFVFGSQKDIRFKAADNGWITLYDSVTNRYLRTNRTEISGRANIEPLPDFRIDLNIARSIAFSYGEFFRYDNDPTSPTFGKFRSFAEVESGNFSITTILIGSSFERIGKNGESKFFDNFENNRFIISRRLAAEDGNFTTDSTGFYDGYGQYSQQVLIPAFLAAYRSKDAGSIGLQAFPKIPLPNWRVNYSGLIKIEIIERYFTNFVVSHAYTSTYNINSFNRPTTVAERYSANNNYVPKYEIQQITLSETFAPLIGFDMTLKNKVNITLDYKQSRNIGLSFANTRVEQLNTFEYNVGLGYTANGLELPFSMGTGQKVLKNDLNMRLDFNIRMNRGVVHRMDQDVSEIINGARVMSIKPSVEYILNQRFQVRVFYDRLVTKPFISTSFPTAITSLGFSLRINIGA